MHKQQKFYLSQGNVSRLTYTDRVYPPIFSTNHYVFQVFFKDLENAESLSDTLTQ